MVPYYSEKTNSYIKYRNRIIRLLLVILLFFIPYYFFGIFNVFSPTGPGPFWYIHAYIAILLLMPFLQRFTAILSKKAEAFLITVIIVPSGLNVVLSGIVGQSILSSFFLSSLSSTYIGMLFIGHYITTYTETSRREALIACAGFVVSSIIEANLTLAKYQVDIKSAYYLEDINSIFIIISAASVFIIARYLGRNAGNQPLWNAIKYLGSCSFAIYLLGSFAITVGWPYVGIFIKLINPLFGLIIFDSILFLACFVVAVLLKKIPGIRKFLE